MVNFPDLSNLTVNSTISDLMALPNNTYPYFWLWILTGIWLITSLTLFFKEKEKVGKGNFLSAMAIAAFAVLLLSVVGTLVGIVSLDIMVYILVFFLVLIGIWFFSN